LAYQPPASSTFLSQQTSHQQPASSTFLSEQTSTSHQPPANRTGFSQKKYCQKILSQKKEKVCQQIDQGKVTEAPVSINCSPEGSVIFPLTCS
jgi:hypothetical protein